MSAEKQEAAILKDSGHVRCTFGPDEMECEDCNISGLQLYYHRTCYEVDEGEYRCLCCVAVAKAKREADADYFVLRHDAIELFRLVLPHIPAKAVNAEKARTHRVSECYLNDAVRAFIGDDVESNPERSGPTADAASEPDVAGSADAKLLDSDRSTGA